MEEEDGDFYKKLTFYTDMNIYISNKTPRKFKARLF